MSRPSTGRPTLINCSAELGSRDRDQSDTTLRHLPGGISRASGECPLRYGEKHGGAGGGFFEDDPGPRLQNQGADRFLAQ
jgi:hypothetical protein